MTILLIYDKDKVRLNELVYYVHWNQQHIQRQIQLRTSDFTCNPDCLKSEQMDALDMLLEIIEQKIFLQRYLQIAYIMLELKLT